MEENHENTSRTLPDDGQATLVQPAADAVLQFLASRHPDDEPALERMLRVLEGVTGAGDELMELVYRGLSRDEDVAAARHDGYIAGRNEQIEMARHMQAAAYPKDDGGAPDDTADLPLLRNIRRSVWDD